MSTPTATPLQPASGSHPLGRVSTGSEHWKKASPGYGVPHLRLRQVGMLLSELKPGSVLDLGCSTGLLKTLLPAETRYVGVDFIEPMERPAFEFHQADLNKEGLPGGLGEFGAISCCGVFEYVEKPVVFLEDLKRHLKPGGHVVLTYFNFNHVHRIWQLLRGKTPHTHPDWRWCHSPSRVKELLESVGLEVVRVQPHRHGFGPSPAIAKTVELPTRLPGRMPWSGLLAHQFIFVAIKR